MSAVRNALFPSKTPKAKTLIDRFHYPERGPGQMWEMLADQLDRQGYPILMERRVVRVCHQGGEVTRMVTRGRHGEECFEGTHFISSMPIRDLINALDPRPSEEVLRAGRRDSL